MKSQGHGREREPGGGEPASPQVADDDTQPRHAIELGNQRHRLVVVEVMKKLRAEHEVHAAIGERERERVAADGMRDAMAGRVKQCKRAIDADGAQVQSPPTRDLACAPGQIRQAGADVEEGGGLVRSTSVLPTKLVEERSQGEHDRPSAAEEHIRPLDVPV